MNTETMKNITLKIKAPKCGASSEELRDLLANTLGAEVDYVGARLSILPPDVKKTINKAKKAIKDTWISNTLPWIGNERVVPEHKMDIVVEEIRAVHERVKQNVAEEAEAMKVWLPQVKAALGRGADMIELPDPSDFKIEIAIGCDDATAAGEGLPKDASHAELTVSAQKGEGYEALIDHLIDTADKIGSSKQGAQAALRLKDDAATAAKMGIVDKKMLEKLNQLTGKLLSAGKSKRKQATAKAALVTAIGEAATSDSVEEEGGAKPTEKETKKETNKETKKKVYKTISKNSGEKSHQDAAVELI